MTKRNTTMTKEEMLAIVKQQRAEKNGYHAIAAHLNSIGARTSTGTKITPRYITFLVHSSKVANKRPTSNAANGATDAGFNPFTTFKGKDSESLSVDERIEAIGVAYHSDIITNVGKLRIIRDFLVGAQT